MVNAFTPGLVLEPGNLPAKLLLERRDVERRRQQPESHDARRVDRSKRRASVAGMPFIYRILTRPS